MVGRGSRKTQRVGKGNREDETIAPAAPLNAPSRGPSRITARRVGGLAALFYQAVSSPPGKPWVDRESSPYPALTCPSYRVFPWGAFLWRSAGLAGGRDAVWATAASTTLA
jgi:hypothetical protein